MTTRFKTLAAVAAASLLMSGYALADKRHPQYEGFHKYAAAAAQVKVTPAQAIATAQKQAPGKATELQLKGRYGTPVYKVEIHQNNQEHTVHVDAISGNILGVRTEHEWKPARPVTIELAHAIQTAQNTVKGSVLEAELDSKRGMLFYKVEILAANNVQHKVIVDASSGKVLESYVDYDD